jgi:hypothetical protein
MNEWIIIIIIIIPTEFDYFVTDAAPFHVWLIIITTLALSLCRTLSPIMLSLSSEEFNLNLRKLLAFCNSLQCAYREFFPLLWSHPQNILTYRAQCVSVLHIINGQCRKSSSLCCNPWYELNCYSNCLQHIT